MGDQDDANSDAGSGWMASMWSAGAAAYNYAAATVNRLEGRATCGLASTTERRRLCCGTLARRMVPCTASEHRWMDRLHDGGPR